MQSIPVRHIRKATMAQEISGDFSIRDVSVMLEGGAIVQDLHRHDFFFLLVLEKGHGHHEIDFIQYPVAAQTVFFMRPGQVHRLELKEGSSGFLMGFHHKFYHPVHQPSVERLRKVSRQHFYLVDQEGFARIISIMRHIYREQLQKQEGWTDAIRSDLDLVFIELSRQCDLCVNREESGNSFAREKLEEFSYLVEKHMRDHKQVKFYTDQLNLSPYQLSGITRQLLGRSPSEIITDQVLLEAKRQLLATTAQVKEIAWQLGYEDVSYFIRFFKKHTEQTPEAFRQKFL